MAAAHLTCPGFVVRDLETGTGKEVVARALHEASARRKRPFVAMDRGALPEGLVESEDGHSSLGAGAAAARAGGAPSRR